MISLLTIKRCNLIERILQIIVSDISKDAANDKFGDCIIKKRELDSIQLEIENGICFINLESKVKKTYLFKYAIEINVSVRMWSQTYTSTINLLDLKDVFTHFGFKFNKDKLDDLLRDELIFLYSRINDVIKLALKKKIEGVDENE